MTEAVGAFSPTFRCIIYGSGIAGSLSLYKMIQDRIVSAPYEGELFKISTFLLLCGQAAATLYAAAMLMIGRNGTPLRPQAPLWKYMLISASSVAAAYCQYEALAQVSLLVQTVSKSFQVLPVMFWSIAIGRKRFGLRDWTVAAFITGGVFMLLLAGSTRSQQIDIRCTRYGASLLLGFLFCTGLTSTLQEKLFHDHQTSKYNQMLWINLLSSGFSLLALVREHSLLQALSFCSAHPAFIGHVLGLSAASVTGQWFIYSQLEEFGALVFATTMNFRQIDVRLIGPMFLQYDNVLQVGNIVAVLQVLALAIIFGVLFGKSVMGCRQRRGSKGERIPLMGKQGAHNAGWVPLGGYQTDTMLGSWQGKAGMQYRMCETAAYAAVKHEVRLPVKEEAKPAKMVVDDDDDDWLDEEGGTGTWLDEERDCWTCSDKDWVQVLEDSPSHSGMSKAQEQTEQTFVRAKQERMPVMPMPPMPVQEQAYAETSTCCSASEEGDEPAFPPTFSSSDGGVSSTESESEQQSDSPRGICVEDNRSENSESPEVSECKELDGNAQVGQDVEHQEEKAEVQHQHQEVRWECYSDPATGKSWWWNPDTEQATFDNPWVAAS